MKLTAKDRKKLSNHFKGVILNTRKPEIKHGKLIKYYQTYSQHLVLIFENGNEILHYIAIKSIIIR